MSRVASHRHLHGSSLQLSQPILDLHARVFSESVVGLIAQRVDAYGQRGLRLHVTPHRKPHGQHSADLSLVLRSGLSDERRVVDQSVLRRLVPHLQRSEERLLGAEDLHGGGGELGEVHQRAGVRDESGAHQFADDDGEVGRDGVHAVLQVLVELQAVGGEVQHLRGELLDVLEVAVADVGAGGDECGALQLLLDVCW